MQAMLRLQGCPKDEAINKGRARIPRSTRLERKVRWQQGACHLDFLHPAAMPYRPAIAVLRVELSGGFASAAPYLHSGALEACPDAKIARAHALCPLQARLG